MATTLLLKDLTAKVITEADLPTTVYFDAEPEPDSSFLSLVQDSTKHEYNGLPVFKIMYAEFGEYDEETGRPGWNGYGQEIFMSEDYARDALLKRAKSDHPESGCAPSARTQLAELVQQSFEKTLGQAGSSLGSILAAHLGEQMSLDRDERRDQLFAAFVGVNSVDYDGAEAHKSFHETHNRIWLPVWKWLEIKTACVALKMLDWHQRGERPTWEQIWDSIGFSGEVNTWLEDSLSGNPTKGTGGHMASTFAVSLQAAFLDMAQLSIDVQAALKSKQAA
jgi:hypothetical protein